ncbi:MAG: site-2 protease family protein [Candidatus Omnitrophica bacterium]|nr:site-2 protease family protein [Candidatus Omnitrophota bacterium]MCF7894297.1 site-2 protease family protein [Candidatus Omnitrophota bacterium]
MELIFSILRIAILVFSLCFHEYCHGWAASKLGDPTPKESGRLTLNPLAHIDLFGTIILPILLAMTAGFPIGYAKPVPINPNHFKNPKKDIKWIGLSGPMANMLLLLVFIILIKINFPFKPFLIYGLIINLIFATINLIPIPPLDGSRVVASFLPYKLSRSYLKIEPYGIILVIILIIISFKTGIFRKFILISMKAIFNLSNINI